MLKERIEHTISDDIGPQIKNRYEYDFRLL